MEIGQKQKGSKMKARLFLIVLVVVAIVGLTMVVEATDKETLNKLDEQIAVYAQNAESLSENIERGIMQIEQMKTQLNQTIGAKFSLEQLKQELLKPVEESADETLADTTPVLHDSEENEKE